MRVVWGAGCGRGGAVVPRGRGRARELPIWPFPGLRRGFARVPGPDVRARARRHARPRGFEARCAPGRSPHRASLRPVARAQSAIEETLKRIEKQPGVEGFVIVDDQGNVLRHRRDMTEEAAKLLADNMWALSQRAMHTVRDIEPTVRSGGGECADAGLGVQHRFEAPVSWLATVCVCVHAQNKLNFFRLRMKHLEVLAAPGTRSSPPARLDSRPGDECASSSVAHTARDGLHYTGGGGRARWRSIRAFVCCRRRTRAGPGYLVVVIQRWQPSEWASESA